MELKQKVRTLDNNTDGLLQISSSAHYLQDTAVAFLQLIDVLAGQLMIIIFQE